jgi:hypothetical protein
MKSETLDFRRADSPRELAIERNPFFLLGISTRDNREAIMQAAREKELSLDPQALSKATSDLTIPRPRLAAELGFLPGLSPKRAGEIIKQMRQMPLLLASNVALEPLALANLIASALDLLDEALPPEEWAALFEKLSKLSEAIDPGSLARLLNEDRAVAGFPEITGPDLIEKELIGRRKEYRDAILRTLERLESTKLLSILQRLAETATAHGTEQAPSLTDSVLDAYHLETEALLEARADAIIAAIAEVKEAAAIGAGLTASLISIIENETALWCHLARPVQLSFKGRGLDHRLSLKLAHTLRNLGVHLANEHQYLEEAKAITNFLARTFPLLPEFKSAIEDDSGKIENLLQQRDDFRQREAEWASEISREIEFGVVFKKKFAISPQGITYDGKHYALDEITRVRWGGTRHSVNGIPTGTSFTIAFGTATSESELDLNNASLYEMVVNSLWKAVGPRLMTELLNALKRGERRRIGPVIVDDKGIFLPRQKLFSKEEHYFPWQDIQIWSANGNFQIAAASNKKCHAQISYILTPNTHVLEACISAAFKDYKGRLSALLN